MGDSPPLRGPSLSSSLDLSSEVEPLRFEALIVLGRPQRQARNFRRFGQGLQQADLYLWPRREQSHHCAPAWSCLRLEFSSACLVRRSVVLGGGRIQRVLWRIGFGR